MLSSTTFVYLGASAVTLAAIAVVAVAVLAVRLTVRACWRLIKRKLTVWRAMKGFDQKARKILPLPSGGHETGHSATDNDRDST